MAIPTVLPAAAFRALPESLWIIQRRVQELGAHATIQPAGSNRVSVEVLGVTGRWWDIMH